ncbi:hypothetical protein A0H81_03290 [Grifola frondosa]|uniref:Uncharacterized protein n=1 Tax=Grifola frondosa TaxID=5627 RepID=A0A1C7MHB3_GRIFR|nr:hypothetical protein A0H81_03290 [Grifola frondosa]
MPLSNQSPASDPASLQGASHGRAYERRPDSPFPVQQEEDEELYDDDDGSATIIAPYQPTVFANHAARIGEEETGIAHLKARVDRLEQTLNTLVNQFAVMLELVVNANITRSNVASSSQEPPLSTRPRRTVDKFVVYLRRTQYPPAQ